jgi:transcription initiation factor TFIIIB Brf1 subunit/transcription initiation factor TFIIB
MADFEQFDRALTKYNELLKEEVDSKTNVESKDVGCQHVDTIEDDGMVVCITCGVQLDRVIEYSKEWRYYGSADNKHTSDPNRVQQRKSDERTIHSDVENMGFSERIVNIANRKFCQVTNGKIYRGDSRRSIVFACIFHAYKKMGKPQSHEKLMNIFELETKNGLHGIKYIKLNTPKEAVYTSSYITPANLVEEIMDKFSATKEQKQQVVDMFNRIKNRSSTLNRSRPQSFASGLVYFWICVTKKDITLDKFAADVGLSDNTIRNIVIEICSILKIPSVL